MWLVNSRANSHKHLSSSLVFNVREVGHVHGSLFMSKNNNGLYTQRFNLNKLIRTGQLVKLNKVKIQMENK